MLLAKYDIWRKIYVSCIQLDASFLLFDVSSYLTIHVLIPKYITFLLNAK